MEKDQELRVEALRLAVGRHPKLLAQDGTAITAGPTEIVTDAEAFYTFLNRAPSGG